MLICYNWNIANDTYVPLPTQQGHATWLIDYLEWLDYWYYDGYLLFTIGISGHC